MIIGAKIAACRKRAGMSQEKLANELNISRQAVSRWETGEAVPDTEKVIQLSRIFHVTTDYLLLDIDEAPQSAAPRRKQQRNGTARRRKANEAPKHAHAFRLVSAHFRHHLVQCNARRRGSLRADAHGMVDKPRPLRHRAVRFLDLSTVHRQCRPHPLRHPHPHPRIHLYRQRVIVRAK